MPERRPLDLAEEPGLADRRGDVPRPSSPSLPSASSLSCATHGSRSSRVFQTSAIDAARPQHPRDLAQRRAVVEPVERLRRP